MDTTRIATVIASTARPPAVKDGYYKDSYGHCVKGNKATGCRDGYYKDNFCHCVKGNKATGCRDGYYKDSHGHCVGNKATGCQDGYYKDNYGHCVKGARPCRDGDFLNAAGQCQNRRDPRTPTPLAALTINSESTGRCVSRETARADG